MAVRPTERNQGNIAVLAASLALAVIFVSPAVGAPVQGTLCGEPGDATLDISESELTASLINHEFESQDEDGRLTADQLLRPLAAATIHKVFADSDDESEPTEAEPAEADESIIMNTRVPGFSDDELARFKRQMLRKDI